MNMPSPHLCPGPLVAIALFALACGDGDSTQCKSQSFMGPSSLLPCQVSWDECSDGRAYTVSCSDQDDSSDFACECNVDGSSSSTFATDNCALSDNDANAECGWDISFPGPDPG